MGNLGTLKFCWMIHTKYTMQEKKVEKVVKIFLSLKQASVLLGVLDQPLLKDLAGAINSWLGRVFSSCTGAHNCLDAVLECCFKIYSMLLGLATLSAIQIVYLNLIT